VASFPGTGSPLNAQVKPLDVDLAVGALACNDQKAEPADVALEIAGNFDRPVRSIP